MTFHRAGEPWGAFERPWKPSLHPTGSEPGSEVHRRRAMSRVKVGFQERLREAVDFLAGAFFLARAELVVALGVALV